LAAAPAALSALRNALHRRELAPCGPPSHEIDGATENVFECARIAEIAAKRRNLFIQLRWISEYNFVLSAFGLRSHSHNSPSRNRHWRPILMAGISLHSAHRQTVRGAMPNHFATAAVVKNGSRFDNTFCMVVLGFGSGEKRSSCAGLS
jgi:hypothetical protein